MTIAGQNFTVSQAGQQPCTYSLSSTSQSFKAGAGTASVGVTTGSTCSRTAKSNASWITVTSGSSGTGSGTVNYSVAANQGSSRSGTMTIAGKTFTVNQAGK
jgi:Putative binding domain, N-terminal